MLDPTKKIEVEIAAKTDKFQDQLRNLGKSTPGLKALGGQLEKKKTQLERSILQDRMKLESPQATKAQQAAAKKNIRFKQLELAITKQQLKETKSITAELAKQKKFNKSFSGTVGGKPTAGGMGGAAAMLGKLGIGAAISALGAVAGAVKAQIDEGYGKWSQYRQAQGGLAGTGATRADMDAAAKGGVKRGYGYTETMQQALTAAKATGNANSVGTLQDLTRTIGMDSGSAAGLMGQMTRGGSGFGGSEGSSGKRELEKSLAAGFASGLDRARMPEFMQGVGKLVEMQGGRQGGDVSGVGFSKMLGAMGMTGASGMKGARGANVLQQLNEAMVKPGGGEAGQALMLQAYGFGKPGGDTGYYEALKRQEQGAMDPENVRDMFAEIERQYGGGQEGALAARSMTGLSLTQVESLRDATKNLDDAGLKKAIEEAKPIEEQSLKQLEGIGEHLVRLHELDARLVNIGETFHKDIEDMQDIYNKGLDKVFPVLKEGTDMARDLLWAIREEFGQSHKGPEKTYDKSDVNDQKRAITAQTAKLGTEDFNPQTVKDAIKQSIVNYGSIISTAGEHDREAGYKARVQHTAGSELLTEMGGKDKASGRHIKLEAINALLNKDQEMPELTQMEQVQRSSFQMAWEAAQKTPNDFTDDTKALEALNANGPLHSILQEAIQLVNKQAAAAREQARANNEGGKRATEAEPTEPIMSYVDN